MLRRVTNRVAQAARVANVGHASCDVDRESANEGEREREGPLGWSQAHVTSSQASWSQVHFVTGQLVTGPLRQAKIAATGPVTK